MNISKIIKKLAKPTATIAIIIVILLSGFPPDPFFDLLKDRNVVDKLYWSLKNPNVIDQGMKNLLLPRVEKAKAATFSMQTGYYIGNAVDNRAITNIGFSPDLVLLKDNTAAGSDGIVWKSTSMSGETTAKLGEAEADVATNYIQSLDSTGFTIGSATDVNSSNVMYFWIAFDGSDCTSNGTFCVGSYSGNGTSQSITTGFQPDIVVVKGTGATQGVWRSSSMGANDTAYFSATTQDTGGQMIQTLNSDGFTVGSNATVNTSGTTYRYFAFKQVSGAMDVGTYSGNATDNRNIDSSVDAGLTFLPNFVFVKNSNAATAVTAVFSITENYGDRSFLPTDTASAVNHIQELRSAGGFQVGTTSNVNGSGNTIYYAAFGGDFSHSASGTFKMANGSYTGTGAGFSITGLGFAPDLVIIKHNDQATDQYAVFRTRDMAGDYTVYFANAATFFTGGITALGADGFTVGTSATVNTSGDTYYWTAFGNAWDAVDHSGATDFLIGAYIGDGVDSRNINRLPFQPDLVAVKRIGNTAGCWRTSAVSGDYTLYFTATAQAANLIQQFNSDGFQRGTAANVNTAGGTYFYFVFKESANAFEVNSYTGNGTSQDVIPGFQPDLIWVKKATGGTARGGILRTSAQSGNAAQPFLNAATISNGITNLLSNGFSVGSAVETNENTYAYQYAAWRGVKAYTQSAYRWFENTDTTDVGNTMTASQDQPATLSLVGQAFRLRLLIHVDNVTLFKSGQDFKLQYVGKGTGSCDSPSGGNPSSYTDVTTSTLIAFNDNSPNDGDNLTPNANDPTHGGHLRVDQDYEEANNFTNTVAAVDRNQDGKWDFALKDNNSPPDSAIYCFRVVKSDDSVLDTYSVNYPEITTISNAAPTVSNVKLNNQNNIDLIENTTTSTSATADISDSSGCSTITNVSAKIYRSGVTNGKDCTANENNCYSVASCSETSCVGNDAVYTCTIDMQFDADPTDANTPWTSEYWRAYIEASDGSLTGSGYSPADAPDVNSLLALEVTNAINYGSLNSGDKNDPLDKITTVTATGNVSLDVTLYGTNMCTDYPTCLVHTMAVGKQKYALSSSTAYSSATSLLVDPGAEAELNCPKTTDSSNKQTKDIWWGIEIPNPQASGSYTGSNTFIGKTNETPWP
jgi:hypothetical protein